MSEKLQTPLEVMPPELRRSIERILTKHQVLAQSPSAASSLSLTAPYAALTSLWQELQWEPYVTDLQQQETALRQQQAERPQALRKQLHEARTSYVGSLQERRQNLAWKKQRFEQKKQELRASMLATRQQLAQKARLLTLSLAHYTDEQPLGYESEWRSAEQRIAEQNMLLQRAEANYPIALQQKKRHLIAAFNELQRSWNKKKQNGPHELAALRQQNAQCRNALPGLVSTWKAEAAEKLMQCNAKLTALRQMLASDDDCELDTATLTSKQQHLNEKKESLMRRRQELNARKHWWPPAPTTRIANGFEAMPYAQLISELPRRLKQNAEPLRLALHELVRCAVSSSELKMQLLTAGLLDPSQFPEIDTTWRSLDR